MVQSWTQDLMGRAHAMACEAVVEALDASLEGGLSQSEASAGEAFGARTRCLN